MFAGRHGGASPGTISNRGRRTSGGGPKSGSCSPGWRRCLCPLPQPLAQRALPAGSRGGSCPIHRGPRFLGSDVVHRCTAVSDLSPRIASTCVVSRAGTAVAPPPGAAWASASEPWRWALSPGRPPAWRQGRSPFRRVIGEHELTEPARRGHSQPRPAGQPAGRRLSAGRPPVRRAAPAGLEWPGHRTAGTPAARRRRSP